MSYPWGSTPFFSLYGQKTLFCIELQLQCSGLMKASWHDGASRMECLAIFMKESSRALLTTSMEEEVLR